MISSKINWIYSISKQIIMEEFEKLSTDVPFTESIKILTRE
jgi:hypothetical protein